MMPDTAIMVHPYYWNRLRQFHDWNPIRAPAGTTDFNDVSPEASSSATFDAHHKFRLGTSAQALAVNGRRQLVVTG